MEQDIQIQEKTMEGLKLEVESKITNMLQGAPSIKGKMVRPFRLDPNALDFWENKPIIQNNKSLIDQTVLVEVASITPRNDNLGDFSEVLKPNYYIRFSGHTKNSNDKVQFWTCYLWFPQSTNPELEASEKMVDFSNEDRNSKGIVNLESEKRKLQVDDLSAILKLLDKAVPVYQVQM